MTHAPVRILIADDNEFVRHGIRSLLGLRPNWQVCGEAVDGHDAIEQCRVLKPDVVLLDITMPALNGLEAARILRREVPDTKILVVSQHDTAHMAQGALEAGALGYIAKSDLSEQLLAAVDTLVGNADPPEPSLHQPASGLESAASTLPELIIVADGDPQVRNLAATVLGERYDVREASSWKELLDLTDRLKADLILADAALPGAKLSQILGLCQDPSTREVPVILLCTSGGQVLPEGTDPKPKDYLRKPFDRETLLARVAIQFEIAGLRRRVENAEGEKDRDFRIIADIGPSMMWLSGVDGRRTFFNRRWLEFTGRTAEQELGDGWAEGIHPDDRLHSLEVYRSAVRARKPFQMEYRLRRSDGQYRWVLSHGAPRLSRAGVFEGYVGSVMDISERKAAEDARVRLAAIVESSDDAIVGKDLKGVITNWNPGAERIFGFREDEAVGKPITIVIPPELQREEEQILRRLASGERIEHFETVRLTKDKRRINVSLTISPIRDSVGRIIGASKIARDITQMKQVEQALRDSEQRMGFSLEAANFGTWHWDIASGKVKWSENMAAIHGQPPESFSGNFDGFVQSMFDEDQHRVRDAVKKALEGDGKYHCEYRYPRADGKLTWMETHGQVTYGDSNLPVAVMGVCWDVTERKRYEEELRQAHEQMEARVRERTSDLERAQERLRMLSGRLLRMQDDERRRIARELHDTVGQLVVALNLNLVPLENELLKTNPDLAKQITASLSLVDELSRDLRTISHLLHPPLLDEAGLQSALRWYVGGFSERSKIAVELHLDPALGRLPAECETAIFRMVQESLTNIHRHSGSSTASISIARNATNVELEIRDQGKGLPVPIPRAGVGIQGMGERVRQLGGSLEISSNSHGTRLLAVFPANTPSSEANPEAIDVAS